VNIPSLWWSGVTDGFPPFDGDLDVDVAIVGGGITGLTLAFALRDQDASVAVFDSGPMAGSASGRNAGFLFAAPAAPYGEHIALWGRADARALLEVGRRSHQRIRHLAESLGIECGYRVTGGWRLTRTDEETEDLRASLPLQAEDGFPMLEASVASAVPPEARDHFRAAFLTREDGEIDPVRFLQGLGRALVARGAHLHSFSPVPTATWSGGLWRLHAGAGTTRARTLVLATNAWTSKLCPELEPLIQPRRGQMLATAPIARSVVNRPTLAHWGYHYWRQTEDGRLVIGGWRDLDLDGETGFEERTTEPIQSAIETGLAELVPEGVAIEHRWSGIMGFARDGRPLVGWLDADHHLAICGGYTGHGMGLAAACTQDLADLLAFRRAPGIGSFDPGRFTEVRALREGVTRLGVVPAQ